MNAPFDALPWDTEFFGVKTGRLLPVNIDQATLANALADARKEGYGLLYWFAKTNVSNHAAATTNGGFLADSKRTYVHALENLRPMDLTVNWFIESYREPEPDVELIRLALAAGEHSRFLRDPRFGRDAFERLYREWIRKSVRRELAEEVLFVEDFGQKRAMLTLGLRMGRPDIGLVATAADYRGRGMAGDLVRASLVWAINRHYREAQVLTQAQNTGACRFYEALGYTVEKEENVYHFWL
jgi:dTDP-4-amino-4,6-dideoxy-D-galactose acyltransferase